jgi:hypothetical protein
MIMNTFYKSYTVTDLTSLYYINFIDALVVSQSEALSFDSKQFHQQVDPSKTKDSFLFFEEHFFVNILVYRKSYDFQFEDLSNEYLKFFSEP